MRFKTIFLVLLGLFFSALSLSAQTPINLHYSSFYPYASDRIIYKIWVEYKIADPVPEDPPPPPPPDFPPPTKPPTEHMYDPMGRPPVDSYADPDDPPPSGGGIGGGPPEPLPYVELYTATYYHYSPRGLFNTRVTTEYDFGRSYLSNRFSDYHARKILSALNISAPGSMSISQLPEISPDCFSTLPGTDTLIFGPEAAHALEEA